MAKHRRTMADGRSASEQFMTLPYGMVRSDAWRTLSGNTLKVLIELSSRFNGGNNGRLSLSYADAAKNLKLGHGTIRRAFDELQIKGFIRLVKRGHWYGRKATEWALTTKPYQGNPPTHNWKHWRPDNNKAKQNSEVASGMEYILP